MADIDIEARTEVTVPDDWTDVDRARIRRRRKHDDVPAGVRPDEELHRHIRRVEPDGRG